MKLTTERIAELRDLTVDKLVSISADAFDQVVDDEIRRMEEGPERDALQALLRDPAVADRWQIVLVGMKKSVEGQLGYKRADLQRARMAAETDPTGEIWDPALRHKVTNREFFKTKDEEFARWRGSSLRFKNGVESRLNDIRKVQYDAKRNLAVAIRGHKTKVLLEFPDEVSDADRELWDSVAV